jgi:RNase P subunit RPR2
MTLMRSNERIAIDCLNCGHCSSVSAEKQRYFGLPPDVSLAQLTKRLICKKCGSKAVQAVRYIEDAPAVVPKAPVGRGIHQKR